MKLYYFKDKRGNFGDDLNAWLWPRIAADLFDEDANELFVGIGTLLNHRLPAEPVKHVFGSGFGYGTLPTVDERWHFHAIRGYDTARLLRVPAERVITDAAVLVRTVPLPRAERADTKIGFIPHCQSSRDYDWESICVDLGWRYVSAEWDVERVMHAMSRCETMVCEAMHGAIVADAMRIPWIPVSCYEHISAFKWNDWLSTMGLRYEPTNVPSLYDVERSANVGDRVRWATKRGLRRLGVWSDSWAPPPPSRTGVAERDAALQAMRIAGSRSPMLSDDTLIERHTERYQERLEALLRDRRPRQRQSGSPQLRR